MDRIDQFPSFIQTTILYLSDDRQSLRDLAKTHRISKAAVYKRIQKGMALLRQEDLSLERQKNVDLQKEVNLKNKEITSLKQLCTSLRRTLIIRSSQIFILNIFKERILKFFPNFKVSRFFPNEKKHILDLWKSFQRAKGELAGFCKGLGKSVQTIQEWQEKYDKFGLAGLSDKPTRPRNFAHQLPSWLLQQIFQLFTRFPDWSAYQYHKYMKYNPAIHFNVSLHTIEKLRYEHLRKSEDVKNAMKKHWQFHQNFEVWTIDFTCLLKMDTCKLQLLTVSDHRSRFMFESILCLETSTNLVVSHLEDLFAKYGRPHMIKADNGQEFRTECRQQIESLGVYLLNSPTYYGQFCASHERIHKTLKGAITDFSTHKNLTRLVEEINIFRQDYNHKWPHPRLNFKTPAEIYYTDEDFIADNVEIVTPYKKDGELRMKFTDRFGLPARLSLPLLANDRSTT